jgi:hypothetical protein
VSERAALWSPRGSAGNRNETIQRHGLLKRNTANNEYRFKTLKKSQMTTALLAYVTHLMLSRSPVQFLHFHGTNN